MENKFLHYKTKEEFEKELPIIPFESIVFIKDINAIYTHNNYYYCLEGGGENLKPGDKSGNLVKFCEYPSREELEKLGYKTDTTTEIDSYLKGLLRWSVVNHSNGILIGKISPFTTGICLLHIYGSGVGSDGNGGTNGDADPTMPRYSSGTFFNTSGEIWSFGSWLGVYYNKSKLRGDADTVDGKHSSDFVGYSTWDESLNNLSGNGIYKLSRSTTDIPETATSGNGGFVINCTYDSSVGYQIFFHNYNTNLFYRRKTNNSWSSWYEFTFKNSSGQLVASGLETKPNGVRITTGPGWYRVFKSNASNAVGLNILLSIERTWNQVSGESYLICISHNSNNNNPDTPVNFVQINGQIETQIIPKIRLVYTHNTSCYIDIYYNYSAENTVNISGIGRGQFFAPTEKIEIIPEGYKTIEFSTGEGLITSTPINANSLGVILSQSEYDSLGEKDPNTFYYITE